MSDPVTSLLESIRKRPRMYVGDLGPRGLHALATALFDECACELLSGFGSGFSVRIMRDGSLEVYDDGRAAHVAPLAEFDGRSRLEIAFTRQEATRTFRGSKKRAVGATAQHGLDLAVVAALSEWLEVISGDGQTVSTARFKYGKQVGPLTHEFGTQLGLTVKFKPDPSIFEHVSFDQKSIAARLLTLAAMTPGATVNVHDERSDEHVTMQLNDGVAGLVRLINRQLTPRSKSITVINHQSESLQLNIAFQPVEEAPDTSLTYVNAVMTMEGGTHWKGFVSGLKSHLKLHPYSSLPESHQNEFSGMTAVVSIWVDDPAYEGPTRTKFALAHLDRTVRAIVKKELGKLPAEEMPSIRNLPLGGLFGWNNLWTIADLQREFPSP